jgi:hypothetical protein
VSRPARKESTHNRKPSTGERDAKQGKQARPPVLRASITTTSMPQRSELGWARCLTHSGQRLARTPMPVSCTHTPRTVTTSRRPGSRTPGGIVRAGKLPGQQQCIGSDGLLDRQIPSSARALRVAGIEESKQSLRLRLLIRTGRSPDERALARVLLRRAQVTAAVNAVGRRTRNACVEKTSPSVGLLVFCVLCCVRGFR